jgi:hypothetical protein
MLVFSGLGSTNLGSTHSSRPDGRYVLASDDGTALYGVRWDLATGTGKADVRLLRRPLGLGACDEAELTLLSLAVDASVQAQGAAINRSVNEGRGVLFLRTFGEPDTDVRPDSACIAARSCAISQTSLVLVYDKASGTVSNVPLGLLASSEKYFLDEARSVFNDDALYLRLTTADGQQQAVAVLTPKGLSSLIELPRGIRLASGLVSGG